MNERGEVREARERQGGEERETKWEIGKKRARARALTGFIVTIPWSQVKYGIIMMSMIMLDSVFLVLAIWLFSEGHETNNSREKLQKYEKYYWAPSMVSRFTCIVPMTVFNLIEFVHFLIKSPCKILHFPFYKISYTHKFNKNLKMAFYDTHFQYLYFSLKNFHIK